MTIVQDALAKASATREQQLALYHELCGIRDAIREKAAPVEAELAQAVAATNACREKEIALAAQVEEIWGPDWIALKRQIGDLARALRFTPKG